MNSKQTIFNCGTIPSVCQNPGFDNEQIHYNSNDGVFAFVQNNQGNRPASFYQDIESADKMIINVVKRNESMIAFRK